MHDLTTVDGADSAFTLYVPYRTGDTSVTVCPGASVLTDVAYTCTGAVSYANGESGVSIVTIGASQFWSIPNQTGTGGVSGAPAVASSGSSSGSRPRSKNTGFISGPTPATNTNSNISNPIQKYIFTKTLRVGSTGEDVKELQKYLNTHGFPVSPSGPGSLGNETNYFGRLTKSALMFFQKSKGLVPDGIMGPITRGVINGN